MIDSHQHFWSVARGDYGWMGPHVAPLLRDFMPADLAPHLARSGIDGTILVQAAETDAETDFLLAIADGTPVVKGVVGWIDMDHDGFADRLGELRRHPKFVGVRPMLQEHADDAFILRPRVLRHLGLLAETGLAFDALCFTRHLGNVHEAFRHVPGLRAVIDHGAKPEIAAGRLDPWRDAIAAVARLPGIHCKVSGLVTEADPQRWTPDDLAPYVDHLVSVFGPDRLMFGSDWPVCTLAARYEDVVAAARITLARRLDPPAVERVFGENARRFYLGAVADG